MAGAEVELVEVPRSLMDFLGRDPENPNRAHRVWFNTWSTAGGNAAALDRAELSGTARLISVFNKHMAVAKQRATQISVPQAVRRIAGLLADAGLTDEQVAEVLDSFAEVATVLVDDVYAGIRADVASGSELDLAMVLLWIRRNAERKAAAAIGASAETTTPVEEDAP